MLQRQVPDREGLKLGITCGDAPLVVMIELGEAGGHLAAAGAGGRHHHQGMTGLNIVVFPQALVADDVGHIRGVTRDGIVAIAAHSQGGEALQKCVRRRLPVVPGQHHAAHIQPQAPENINEAQDIVIIGDAQISPDLALFDVRRIDGNDDLHILLELLEHADLAVRLKARQHPGSMEIVKQLAAEFQIQLAAELGDPLFDVGRLGGQVFLIIKANGCHMHTTPFSFFPAQYITFVLIWKDKPHLSQLSAAPSKRLPHILPSTAVPGGTHVRFRQILGSTPGNRSTLLAKFMLNITSLCFTNADSPDIISKVRRFWKKPGRRQSS